MTKLLAVLAVLVGTFLVSLAVERVFGRSRSEMVKSGWFYVFFGVFTPLLLLVYNTVSVDSTLLYAAYALAASVAALAAQCCFGAKVAQLK